jgi:two-component system, NarL family, response regulator LiaR
MVKGNRDGDIAEQLVLSRSTVNFHVSNVLGKLGVATRTQAVTLALEQHRVD